MQNMAVKIEYTNQEIKIQFLKYKSYYKLILIVNFMY